MLYGSGGIVLLVLYMKTPPCKFVWDTHLMEERVRLVGYTREVDPFGEVCARLPPTEEMRRFAKS